MQTTTLNSRGCTGRSTGDYKLKQMVQGHGRPARTSPTLAIVITVCSRGRSRALSLGNILGLKQEMVLRVLSLISGPE